ncbi:MAG: hypothetical protein EXQ93_03170 [Alphaproteobacteria bacterium]|nr:hypothetical protein [Alphaproteobacteria bacterium]
MLRCSFVLEAPSAPLVTTLPAHAAAALLPMPVLDKRGFYVADWLRPTSGDLTRDIGLAAAEDKVFAVLWEMTPCPMCDLLHGEALRQPEIHEYLADRFYTVRFDYRGDEMVADFNGAQRTQRDLARAHRVVGTPTLSFRTKDRREVARIPGYLPPKMLLAAFEYVDQGGYLKTDMLSWIRRKVL